MTADALAAEARRKANGDPGKASSASREATLVDDGGTESAPQGGKVFSDTNGGKLFGTAGGPVI